MKKILTLAFALVIIQLSVFAQVQRNGGARTQSKRGGMQNEMSLENIEGLNLTESQKSQIAVVKEETKTKMQVIKNSAATEDVKKQQMQELRSSTKSKMENILTADQKALLKEKKSEAKQNGGKGKEQMKEKIKNMSPETKAKLKAIKDDATLTKEQKKEAFKKIMMEEKGKTTSRVS